MGLFYQYWTQRKQIQESEYFTQEWSLVINYSSRFVQYPHYPIACCLRHLSSVAHNCHGKSTLTSRQKEKDSRQKSFCHEVILFCGEVILFAVTLFFLPWGFSFCREVFQVFLFAMRFFFSVCHEVILFAVRFFFLPWGYSFCREVFLFAVRLILLPWQLWATVLPSFEILFPKILDFSTCGYSGVRTSTNFAYLTSF